MRGTKIAGLAALSAALTLAGVACTSPADSPGQSEPTAVITTNAATTVTAATAPETTTSATAASTATPPTTTTAAETMQGGENTTAVGGTASGGTPPQTFGVLEFTDVTTAATTPPETPTAVSTAQTRIPGPTPPTAAPPLTADPGYAAAGEFRDSVAFEILALVNERRSEAGLPPLQWLEGLEMTAKARVVELPVCFDPDHLRPSGVKWYTLLQEAGLNYSYAGENLARGGGGSRGAEWYSPRRVVQSWMDSEGHRRNILNSGFEYIGVAAFDVGGLRYYVQHFGSFH